MNTRTENLRAQIGDAPFLTDAGMETDLIFNHGLELPEFASFDLLSTDWGREKLRDYYQAFLDLARRHHSGFILETPTWRASADWGRKLGYSAGDIAAVNVDAVKLMQELRAANTDVSPVLVSGNIGPRGDGYVVGCRMTAAEARDYHSHQQQAFAGAGVDLVSAFTLNYVEEGLGVAQAAQALDLPVVLSFTVETDGRLPCGDQLGDAIAGIDDATGGYPLYYMINCAHPTHFSAMLAAGGSWRERIHGVRGNASKCSHAELDEAEELDDGNPGELGEDYRQLRSLLPRLQVYGGCCGTDLRHVERIAEACLH